MKNKHRSSEEIIELIAKVLSNEPKTLHKLSREASTNSALLKDKTIERYLYIIVKVQKLFKGKEVHFQKQKFDENYYKVAWIEDSE